MGGSVAKSVEPAPGRRHSRQWALVGLLLLAAFIAVGTLLIPSVLSEVAPRRKSQLASVDGGALPSGKSATKTEAGPKEAAAAPDAVEPEEIVPYGDKTLAQEEAIRGRVVDREGKPVPDAILVAAYKDWRARPYALVLASRVRSEEDGTFVLGPLARESYWVLGLHKKEGVGYSSDHMPGAWVELVLAGGAQVKGTVTERESGKPVAGATVLVKDWSYKQETTTDSEGKYTLAPLPATTNTWSGHQVVVVADGFKRAERNNLMLKNDKTETIDFALETGSTLRGKVLNARTLQPVPGATVSDGWESFHAKTTSGEDGTFALENVESGPNIEFSVLADGFLPQSRQSDGTGRLEFQLEPSLVLEGKVVSPRDKPLVGARVYLHRIKGVDGTKSGGSNRGKTRTTTDAEGKFRFEDVLPGQVAVVAFHDEHAPGETKPIDIPEGGPAPTDTTVRLREGMTVTGEVRDLKNQPIPAIRVEFQRWGWQAKGYKYMQRYYWSENPVWYTDEKGAFKLVGAVPGQAWLTVWDKTYGWSSAQVKGVEGQQVTGVIISFAGQAISGTLVNASGEPMPGLWIQARGPKNVKPLGWRWTRTDILGRFKLGGLKDGSYDLMINWSNVGTADPLKDIPAGTTGVEMKLKPTQVLRGAVTSVLSGRAIEKFHLGIQPKRGPDNRYRGSGWNGEIRSPDGRFERPLSPGKYTVTVKARGHAPAVVDEFIIEEHFAPGETFLSLEGGGGIRGTALDAEGKPLRRANVQANVFRGPGAKAEPTDWMLRGFDRTDSSGRFFIEGLAPGTYMLSVKWRNEGSDRRQVVVQGAEMVQQDLRLLPNGTVILRAVDPDGKPVAGLSFQFRDDNNQWIGWARQTNAEGISTSRPMRMGPANVTAHHNKNEWVADPFTVTIPPGKSVEVEVKVRKRES